MSVALTETSAVGKPLSARLTPEHQVLQASPFPFLTASDYLKRLGGGYNQAFWRTKPLAESFYVPNSDLRDACAFCICHA
jgi:hypothetical protein